MSTAVTSFRDLATRNLRQGGILVAFAAIVVVFAVVKREFLSPTNLTNIILQYGYILILAIGMVMVIVAAQIDLSVGSVIALSGAVAATMVVRYQYPWWVGVLAALGVGLLVGIWQGFWVAVVGIPGFIVTLAGMLLFRGLTLLVLRNISLSPFGGKYYMISNGFENGLFGGHGFDVFTVVVFGIAVAGYAFSQWRTRVGQINYQQEVSPLPLFILKLVLIGVAVMWFGYQISRNRGLPFVLIILTVLILAYTLITQRTVFGRNIYAIGGNINAAQLSGVKVRRVQFWVFVNMGVLAGVAGIVYSSRMNGAQPAAGNGVELDAIAACFIGGASTTGGVGRVSGAIVGGLIMAVMSNGMQLLGWSVSIQQVVKGMILLLAVAFDLWNKRRAGNLRS